MRDHAAEAIALLGEASAADVKADRLRQLALTRLLEIVGEAARRVPPDFQAQHPAIPWRDATGTRNKISHGYDSVDLDIVHAIVSHDLPVLVARLDRLLAQAPPSS